jgi:glucokinase
MLFKPLIEKVLQEETIPASLEVCRIIPAGLGESIGDFAALCVAIYEDKF